MSIITKKVIKLAENRVCVWFNEADKQRYAALGIGTELKDKVKSLFYDFLDKAELEKLQRDKFLSKEEIERITFEQLKKLNVIKA